MQDDKDMAPAARVSRRKDTAPVEVDAAAVLLGLKQPLFASQGRSSAASWRGSLATACLAVGCVLVGFMLASVMYERELYHRGVPLHTFVAEKGRFDPSKVPSLRDILDQKHSPNRLLEASEVPLCEHMPEPDDLETLPEKIRFLMIIGTQKTGTTWLFRALTKHPAFIATIRRPGENDDIGNSTFQSKEPQHFNRWPMMSTEEYLHAWHSGVVGAMMSASAGDRILLDASPQYLMTAAAPVRIKAVAPHALFVLVIRDPPMRAYSDYVMMSRLKRPDINPSRLVPKPTFLEQVTSELEGFQKHPECSFNTSASDHRTWYDCYKCAYSFIDVRRNRIKDACSRLQAPEHSPFGNCSQPHFGFLEHGLYATQIAWWLQFFPPEQFLIVSGSQLRDPVLQLKILNDIRRHAGIESAEVFTEDLINGTRGFNGNYAGEGFTEDDLQAFRLLREFYRKPMEDLKALIATVYPHQNFTLGLES